MDIKKFSRKKLRHFIKGLINKSLDKEEMKWCGVIANETKD